LLRGGVLWMTPLATEAGGRPLTTVPGPLLISDEDAAIGSYAAATTGWDPERGPAGGGPSEPPFSHRSPSQAQTGEKIPLDTVTLAHRFSGESPATMVVALTEVLRAEGRLLQELLAVMQRQRAAIAADDLQSVEDSVYATHRVLHTLNEARRRHRSINRMLGESDDLSIRDLDLVLGDAMPHELRASRDELELLARALASEVDINRRVVRQALASGDEYVRTLRGSVEHRAGDSAAPDSGPDRAGGYLTSTP
jgi:hypothetical protein